MNATELPDIERARFNMIEQQIRPWSVSDLRVLDALAGLRRERFVSSGMQALAFSDVELPIVIDGIDTHETMLAPKLEARLAQALQLQATDCVLEIGTGSGFQAALLARLAQQVASVEIDSRTAAYAVQNLQRNQVDNVRLEVGSAHAGWGAFSPDRTKRATSRASGLAVRHALSNQTASSAAPSTRVVSVASSHPGGFPKAASIFRAVSLRIPRLFPVLLSCAPARKFAHCEYDIPTRAAAATGPPTSFSSFFMA